MDKKDLTKLSRKSEITNKIVLVMCYIVIAVVLFCLFLPLFLTIICMFKNKQEIFPTEFHLFPINPTIDNFTRIAYLQYTSIGINFFQSLFMTLLVASISTIMSLFVNSLAGYAFARLNFPAKKLFWIITLMTMFIPGITILLTSISVVSALGMMNTIWVLIIPGVASAYNIFFFRQFYLGFPKDYDESARVDGCNSFSIFFRIYLPSSATPMVIMGAGTFIGYFNSYLWPTLTIDSDHAYLAQIMTTINKLFNDASTQGYGSVLAASFIALIPAVIIFCIVQRYIKDGIALTGVK
ncbi:MAG: carbohydrate ABC transporter permease [Bacillales bacterium]|nr:carbohydrate ABC transporter permease [Bacillales bacterium]MDY6003006.1 carbohydrate ABC transporter permease [Bacilli bacterium]